MVKGQRENYNSVRPPYVIIQYVSLIFFSAPVSHPLVVVIARVVFSGVKQGKKKKTTGDEKKSMYY